MQTTQTGSPSCGREGVIPKLKLGCDNGLPTDDRCTQEIRALMMDRVGPSSLMGDSSQITHAGQDLQAIRDGVNVWQEEDLRLQGRGIDEVHGHDDKGGGAQQWGQLISQGEHGEVGLQNCTKKVGGATLTTDAGVFLKAALARFKNCFQQCWCFKKATGRSKKAEQPLDTKKR